MDLAADAIEPLQTWRSVITAVLLNIVPGCEAQRTGGRP